MKVRGAKGFSRRQGAKIENFHGIGFAKV